MRDYWCLRGVVAVNTRHYSGSLRMVDRWTIRQVSDDARTMVEEVHELTGIPYGRLVTEAIRVWFDQLLDEGDPATPSTRFLTRPNASVSRTPAGVHTVTGTRRAGRKKQEGT